jgi:integrase
VQILVQFLLAKLTMAITKPTANFLFDTRSKLKKTGKYPLKLVVYFLGHKRRYGLPYSFTEAEWKKLNSTKLRDNALKEAKIKLDYYIGDKFEHALKKIDGVFDFEKFKTAYFEDTKLNLSNRDVYVVFNEYISKLKKSGQVGTAEIYTTALKTFQNFRKRLSFNNVTVVFLEEYEKQMLSEGKSVAYIAMNLRSLRAVYNMAISSGLVGSEKYPFSKSANDKKYKIKKGSNIKKALTEGELKLLKSYVPKTPAQRKAYLFWWFSFYANGLNMKDICLLRNKNITVDKIEIYRAKTEHSNNSPQKIAMKLSPEINAIISEIGNQDKSPDAYIFNILKHGISAQQERDSIQSFTRNINKHMKKISEEVGLSDVITTYWARHSFSTYLKRKGVSIEVISEALGHSSIKTTRTYLDSFTDETLEKTAELLADI